MARVAGRTFSRAEVAEAAWRVIVREGLARTSMRAIGRELGASSGVVTYHFKDKTDLLFFALDRLTTAVGRAVDEAAAEADGVDRLRRVMAAILPTGPREVTGWRIWVAFLGQSIGNPRLAAEHQRRLDGLSDRLTTQLTELQAKGLVRKALDPRAEAEVLIAFSDGIGIAHLLRPDRFPAERQMALIDRHLVDRLGCSLPAAGPKPRSKRQGRAH